MKKQLCLCSMAFKDLQLKNGPEERSTIEALIYANAINIMNPETPLEKVRI